MAKVKIEMFFGVDKSDVGIIRFEDNKIYFEDMDEERSFQKKNLLL